jgi:hypothetical protein
MKGKKDEPIPKEAMDHFTRVKQTRNPRPPLSDFERTLNKDTWWEETRAVQKLNVAGRTAFCQNSMIEEELLVIEHGEERYKQPVLVAPIVWKFELGKDLVDLAQILMLPTTMRQLHSWYKTQKGAIFGARYFDKHLHKVENIV